MTYIYRIEFFLLQVMKYADLQSNLVLVFYEKLGILITSHLFMIYRWHSTLFLQVFILKSLLKTNMNALNDKIHFKQ